MTQATAVRERPGRAFVITQSALLAVHLLGTFGVLLCAVVAGGHRPQAQTAGRTSGTSTCEMPV
jgi:hypothetical protein